MATNDDTVSGFLDSIDDPGLRRRCAEAFSREYSVLSETAHRIFEVAGGVEDVDVEVLRGVDPETVQEELRRCAVAVARLAAALRDVAARVDATAAVD